MVSLPLSSSLSVSFALLHSLCHPLFPSYSSLHLSDLSQNVSQNSQLHASTLEMDFSSKYLH